VARSAALVLGDGLTHEGEHDRGAPAEEYDPVGTIEGGEQSPGSIKRDVAVAERYVRHGGEVEGGVEVGERSDREVGRRQEADLDQRRHKTSPSPLPR
jgi:hypothetical protein